MNLALPEKKVTSVFCTWHRLVPRVPSLQILLQTAKIVLSLDSRIISATSVIAIMIIIAAHVELWVSVRH